MAGFTYKLEILNGEELVSTVTNGPTITEDDVRWICKELSDAKKGKPTLIIPIEPDFQMIIEKDPSDDEAYISIFIDEAARRHDGYSSSGVGVRLAVTQSEIDAFAKQLQEELKRVKAARGD